MTSLLPRVGGREPRVIESGHGSRCSSHHLVFQNSDRRTRGEKALAAVVLQRAGDHEVYRLTERNASGKVSQVGAIKMRDVGSSVSGVATVT